MAARCSARRRWIQPRDGHGICVRSQPALGSSWGCDIPALELGDLLRASRLMGMAAAPSTGNREVTPGTGMRPRPGKTKCRRQKHPLHPPTCLCKGCTEQSPDGNVLPKVKESRCLQPARRGRGTKIVTVLEWRWRLKESSREEPTQGQQPLLSTSHPARSSPAQGQGAAARRPCGGRRCCGGIRGAQVTQV